MIQTNYSEGLQFSKTEKRIAFGLFILLWIYLFIRAIYVPVLHDEIATFFYYIQSDNYLPPNAHWDANNHILNSFFGNISYRLFGSSPLALRLPNVLSFAFLFYGAFQLAGRLKQPFSRWGLLLALTCSHYLFEYIGECRGYGMSMAFFVMALYHYLKLRKDLSIKPILYTTAFLFLGTAANLTLIIPSVLLFGLMGLQFLLSQQKTPDKVVHIGFLGLCVIPFLPLVQFSFMLKDRGALYYGGDSGFYDITVQSVTKVFTGIYNTPIAILITLLFIGFVVFLVKEFYQNKSFKALLTPTAGFTFLITFTVLSILILSYGLKVNFPEDRAAMHLYVLFVTALAFTADQLALTKRQFAFISLPLFYFPLLFLFHVSPTASVFSTEERTSFAIYDYIRQSENDFKFPHTVGGYKTQEFCWYYMNHLNGGNEGKIHTNFHIALDADFQIVRDGKIEDSTLFNYYDPVLSDPSTALTLFERKNKLNKTEVFSAPVNPTNGTIKDEYHNILVMDIEYLRHSTLYIGAEMTLEAQAAPFTSWLAVTVNDENDQSVYSEYIALDWIRKKWDGSQTNLIQGTLLHYIPDNAKTLKFYIWNIDKTSFSIPDGKCYLYELERDFPNQY